MQIISSGLKEECGVFGVFGCERASELCYLGLYALQHRGQESAGLVSADKSHFYVAKEMGLVSEIFDNATISYLKGDSAIGHVRYSTSGASNITNIQPIFSKTSKGKLAIAHNGNITNAFIHYKRLKEEGALFQSTTDTEVILHIIAKSRETNILESLKKALAQMEGAFSLVILGEGYMMAARDPWGFRPLVLGKLCDGFIVSSETCALDLLGAEYIREIEPGEIIYINKNIGVTSARIPSKSVVKSCVFEHVYFSRPDSIIFGESVHQVRKNLGKMLAREHHIEGDLVMAIPDSGNSAALGYAQESGIPFEIGMTRNHYIGRTFIQPHQRIRDIGVKVKLNPIRSVLQDKRVIVVDDSLVRGTTSRQRVSAIRKAGAKEIHFRVSSPPVMHPCHFGIDTPKREKLIAAQKAINEVRRYIGADSLGYLSIRGMLSAVTRDSKTFCTACFDGKYPIKPQIKGKFSIEDRKISLHAQKRRY